MVSIYGSLSDNCKPKNKLFASLATCFTIYFVIISKTEYFCYKYLSFYDFNGIFVRLPQKNEEKLAQIVV